MKKIFFTYLFLAFLQFDSFAQNMRETTFDQRPACEEVSGVWREFGNSCANKCMSKLDRFSICSQVITNACDCGKGRCWDGETCVDLKDYKKIYDQSLSEEKALLEVAKKQRREKYKNSADARLEALNKGAFANQDNNRYASNRSDDQEMKKPITNQPVNQILAPESKPESFVAKPASVQASASAQNPVANSAQSQAQPKPIALPPFFLQQEKSKQNQATPAQTDSNITKVGGAANKDTKSNDSDLFTIPGLPNIPLPN